MIVKNMIRKNVDKHIMRMYNILVCDRSLLC